MTKSLTLYRLQQLDTRLTQIEIRTATIQKTLEGDIELNAARQSAENAHLEVIKTEKELKQIEYEVESQRIKIEQTESSLYGGNIKNPKELQDLQAESSALKRHLAALEDRELETMISLETAQATNKQAASSLATTQAQVNAKNKDLTIELENLLKEAERLKVEREATVNTIEPPTRELYEQIKADRRGVAVTTISEGSCNGCGAMLNQAQQQSAYHSLEIVRCPTCGRILYGK